MTLSCCMALNEKGPKPKATEICGKKTPGDFNALRDQNQNINGAFKGDGGLYNNKTEPQVKIM